MPTTKEVQPQKPQDLGTLQNFQQQPDGQHEKEETDDFSRELGGALVYFQDGAEVCNVFLPVDFPANPFR